MAYVVGADHPLAKLHTKRLKAGTQDTHSEVQVHDSISQVGNKPRKLVSSNQSALNQARSLAETTR